MNTVPIQLLVPISVLTSVTVVILLFLIHPFLSLAVPLGFLLAIMVSRPKLALAIFWGMTILVPSIEIVFPSILVKILEHGMFLLLTGILAASFMLGRNKLKSAIPLVYAFIGILLIAVLSMLVNESPPLLAVYFSLIYFKHFILFLYVQQFCDNDDAKWLMYMIITTCIIQFVLSLLCFAGANPLPSLAGLSYFDSYIGSLGNAHDLGYVMIFFMLLMAKLYLSSPVRLYRCLAAIGLIVGFAQFFMTFTMHAYLYLLLGFGIFFLMHGKSLVIQIAKLAGATFLLVGVAGVLFVSSPDYSLSSEIFDPHRLEQRVTRTLHGPKARAYEEVFLDADKHLPVPLLGGGPGNYTSILAFDNNRPKAYLPHLMIHYSDIFRNLTYRGSLLSSPRSGFITIYGELGPIGFVLYFGCFLYVIYVIYRQYAAGLYVDKIRNILAAAFVPSMIIFLLLNLLNDSVRALHLNLGMWIWAAMIYRPCRPAQPDDMADDLLVDSAHAVGLVSRQASSI